MRERPPFWVSLSASAIRAMPVGRYQLANAVARFGGEPFRARLPVDLGGSSFVCDLRDTISREVCFTGRYEPQETQLARRLLGPGMIVADVGANWGYFTLVCAHLVGLEGAVLALEPHPRLAAMLAANVTDNSLTQVAVHRVAAGAAPGSTSFVAFDEQGGNWGVSRAAQSSEIADFESRAVALDEFLDEHARGRRIDLVKMDIEGAEADALRGMATGLSAHRYRYVLVECHPLELARTGISLLDCLAPLRAAGYSGWHINHSADMHRRAAAGSVPSADMLAPIDDRLLAADHWPHLLWAAPGESPPA